MTAGVPIFAQRFEVRDTECEPAGDWVNRAACRRSLNKLWISTPTAATRPHQIELADEVCGRCPVRRDCRDWVRTGSEFEGIAAGLLWPSAGLCSGGHGRGGRRDKWCGGCQARRVAF